ncbi:hypothetical protein NEMIN01_0987 [Nematocida minor]|uniref:uncharacterized protein n=1 Tax=Nematocida minor TaxID=1912983 RepID=UPI0022209577|nr:uncharacterized protein NEMIN01_0987 [Nematocida minor]KAI5190288.1 hypothetical protein NEMIN01_0987 [Nematocida minor]
MSSFINMNYMCSQISLPACSVLFRNNVHAQYPSRSIQIFNLNMYSPYTIMVLAMNIVMTLVLINRTKIKYSFPARKEMLIFLKVYLGSLLFDLVLCLGVVRTSWSIAYAALVSFQVACTVTCFVSAMCTGLVWMLPNRVASSCKNIAWFLTACSLAATFFGSLLSITAGIGEGLFLLLYIVPFFFATLFSFTQLSKLKILNAEIWYYGSLLVTILLVSVIALTPVVFGMLIVMVSDRYLDGIFLIHVLAMFAVIKIYDLWCIDNEQEIECVNTVELVNK